MEANRILNNLACILSVMTAMSLWVSQTENWKVYVPIVLLIITFKNMWYGSK